MPPIDPVCILWAPVVSVVVDFIKRVPFIAKYPQLVAFFIVLAINYLNLHPSPGTSLPISQLVVCVLLGVQGAHVFHEMIAEPTGLSTAVSGWKDMPGDAEKARADAPTGAPTA